MENKDTSPQEEISCKACGHLNPSWRSECSECSANLSTGATPKSVTPPKNAAIRAFLITIGVGLALAALMGVIGILYGLPPELARLFDLIAQYTCPAAIIIAIVAFFWSKINGG